MSLQLPVYRLLSGGPAYPVFENNKTAVISWERHKTVMFKNLRIGRRGFGHAFSCNILQICGGNLRDCLERAVKKGSKKVNKKTMPNDQLFLDF